MQTFLPLPCFYASAECLDRARLGKQRVEALQILNCHIGTNSSGWRNHPAVRMWRGHLQALASYGLVICNTWRARGYFDSGADIFNNYLLTCPEWSDDMLPPWFGNEAFHSAHRAALLAKDPAHYSQFGWSEVPGIEYVWPVP